MINSATVSGTSIVTGPKSMLRRIISALLFYICLASPAICKSTFPFIECNSNAMLTRYSLIHNFEKSNASWTCFNVTRAVHDVKGCKGRCCKVEPFSLFFEASACSAARTRAVITNAKGSFVLKPRMIQYENRQYMLRISPVSTATLPGVCIQVTNKQCAPEDLLGRYSFMDKVQKCCPVNNIVYKLQYPYPLLPNIIDNEPLPSHPEIYPYPPVPPVTNYNPPPSLYVIVDKPPPAPPSPPDLYPHPPVPVTEDITSPPVPPPSLYVIIEDIPPPSPPSPPDLYPYPPVPPHTTSFPNMSTPLPVSEFPSPSPPDDHPPPSPLPLPSPIDDKYPSPPVYNAWKAS